ncbi:protein US31 [Panine betaherpesvirus 2]|uniref:Protein US31 n=1 Tax=Panine betaherpesvirus 2 TaxID=188763 RepID=Q8QRS9_9BETA|nr:protein US31 [Panine betaherpesvirus 2]AAM00809.1 protein US31 [Panine betaherpesvirus 2]QXV67927.1 protein US31 [Panine betaherpesvirus 2]
MSLLEREERWRRVIDYSHELWCDCGNWQTHVEIQDDGPNSQEPEPAHWLQYVECQWQLRVRDSHDRWCLCNGWRDHALRGRWGTAYSSGSSASSSGFVAESKFTWWKRLRHATRRWMFRRNRHRSPSRYSSSSSEDDDGSSLRTNEAYVRSQR